MFFRRGSDRPQDVPGRGPSRRRVVGAGALGLFGAAILSACGSNEGESSANASATGSGSTSSAPPFKPSVTVVPARGTQGYNPTAPLSVTTDDGTIRSVSVTGGKEKVEGETSEDGRTWTAQGDLEFDTAYTVAYVVAKDGATHEGSTTFSTVAAADEADISFNIQNGQTYGTGEVIQMTFSEPVTNRSAVEKAVTVTGGGDQQGRFRWYTDQMVRYRPQDKWAPHSSVRVTVKLKGQDIGNGMIVNQDYDITFKTGAKNYAYVDNDTKTMKIYEDDKLTREFPVTLGGPEWPSTTGQLVIMEQAKKYFFNSRSLGLKPGDAHWYEPFYATNTNRLTSSGAFVHQAEPSAYAYVGVSNISHGCVGLLPDGAEYFYDTFRVGDVVEVVNTGYPQADPDNGYGDWNIPFANYSDSSWKGNW